MKIGIYCTNNYAYPLPKDIIYANFAIAVELADGLTSLGEDVTLFAPIGTETKAKLETFEMLPFNDTSIKAAYPHFGSSYQYENIMIMKALNYMQENNFDIFHAHCRPFSVLDFAPVKPTMPTVVTFHDPLSDDAYKILPLYQDFKNLHFTSLSQAQRKTGPELTWAGNVYNGVDLETFTFQPNKGNYLFFSGRIMPEKGVDIAVQVALKAGLPLKIAGSIYPSMQPYFDEKIKPYLSDQIEYLGMIPRTEQVKHFQNALAFLMPIQWEEPFGLVAIESMSCGTPVIAMNRGALSEIIEDGISGFLVNSMDEMTAKILQIDAIARPAVRQRIEKNFSITTMVENYRTLYTTIV
jgi:glycosyltransferase involved in cell wall biosynthesis